MYYTCLRKLVLITVPSIVVAAAVAMTAVEVWVRWRWDDRRGTPGFYISDPELGQRLAPNYDGWFAGVPVHINALGFRDTRDYALAKSANTFRILVLGDSVTFGHGALSDTTYPYLFEQRLKQWRPDVDWQVWNLGVPGYNTRQELKYLERVGPRYQPDLVIVGFYENDLVDNDVSTDATLRRRLTSAVQGSMQRWLYSFELYKRTALTIRWQRLTMAPDRGRLEALAGDEALLERRADTTMDAMRRLTDVDRFDGPFHCKAVDTNPNRDRLATHLSEDTPSIQMWKRSVAELQRLHRDGVYRIAFFANMVPNVCPEEDRFFDNGAFEDEAALFAVLGRDTPAGSSMRAFLPYRPTEMPGAGGHSIGNANRVKADALFEFVVGSGLLIRDRGSGL